jgi:hypothetical protein
MTKGGWDPKERGQGKKDDTRIEVPAETNLLQTAFKLSVLMTKSNQSWLSAD